MEISTKWTWRNVTARFALCWQRLIRDPYISYMLWSVALPRALFKNTVKTVLRLSVAWVLESKQSLYAKWCNKYFFYPFEVNFSFWPLMQSVRTPYDVIPGFYLILRNRAFVKKREENSNRVKFKYSIAELFTDTYLYINRFRSLLKYSYLLPFQKNCTLFFKEKTDKIYSWAVAIACCSYSLLFMSLRRRK